MALNVRSLKLIGQLYRLNDSLFIDLTGCTRVFGHTYTCIMRKLSFRDENISAKHKQNVEINYLRKCRPKLRPDCVLLNSFCPSETLVMRTKELT